MSSFGPSLLMDILPTLFSKLAVIFSLESKASLHFISSGSLSQKEDLDTLDNSESKARGHPH